MIRSLHDAILKAEILVEIFCCLFSVFLSTEVDNVFTLDKKFYVFFGTIVRIYMFVSLTFFLLFFCPFLSYFISFSVTSPHSGLGNPGLNITI